MTTFVPFPKIDQFRHAIRHVSTSTRFKGKDDQGQPIYDASVPLPSITFRGTVKLHGTNAGLGFFPSVGVWAQSRNRVLTLDKDNSGFCAFVVKQKDALSAMCVSLLAELKDDEKNTALDDQHQQELVVFGEWCGGNIQAKVGINGLPLMFVVFEVKYGHRWLGCDFPSVRGKALPEGVYNILDFPTFEMEVDFQAPEQSQNAFVKMTETVEACCPVASFFGRQEGKSCTTGEGIVWRGIFQGEPLRFKVKGEKHAGSKVKKLATVAPEKMSSIKQFVEYAVTENRLTQGLEHVKHERADTRKFIRWVREDVFKEESDTLSASGLTEADVATSLQRAASHWFRKSCM